MKRFLVTLALAATAIAAAACSPAASPSQAPGSGDPSQPPAGDAVVITAKDLKFDKTELQVPAGAAFTLRFENQEAPPHNVAIYTAESGGTPIYVGEIFSSGTRDYAVPAIEAGTYFFKCDVHPDMKGSVVAG